MHIGTVYLGTWRRLLLATPALLAALAAGCGGGSPDPAAGGGNGHITGLVVQGPVAGATVTAYQLDASMARGAALGSATSATDGTFDVVIPPYNGALEVVASGGTYPEAAVGVSVQLTRDLTTVVAAFRAGASVAVAISPVSTLVRQLTAAEIQRGSSFADADAHAWSHVNAHFAGIDWHHVVPTDLTPAAPGTVTMSDATKAALVLAALSQEARSVSQASGLSPGTGVTASTLGGAVADDAVDGTLDGRASGTALTQATVTLTGQVLRGDLAEAVLAFVRSSRNNTNLRSGDIWALATAMATNNDPYLFCPGQSVCVTTLPPSPSLRAGVRTYYDEREMTLANGDVPPSYAFPAGTNKADPVLGGVYKSATRLAWTAQPTVEELEGLNPDNVPFVQVRIPVGGSQLPIATITYAIDDGTTRYTGALDPWKSPQSTITNLYYDIPLSASTVSSLTGSGPSPRTLDIYVTAADTGSLIANNIHVGAIAFHIMGPPLHVVEDTAYATYADRHSTFAYALTSTTLPYARLWDSSVPDFTAGQVRLVRYVVKNPAPYPVAVEALFTTTGTQGWRMAETWQRFNAGNLPTVGFGIDGFGFEDTPCQCNGSGCAARAPSDCHWVNPCDGIAGGHSSFGHVVGSSTYLNCPPVAPKGYGPVSSHPFPLDVAFTIDASFTAAVGTQFFTGLSPVANEYVLAPQTDGYTVIPGAYGTSPGQLALYLVRPAAAARVYPGFAWNLYTGSNRYEVLENVGYYAMVAQAPYDLNTYLTLYQGIFGAAYLESTTESLSGTVAVHTRGLSGAFAVGEGTTALAAGLNVTLSTH